MKYKVNPLSKDELREIARRMYAVLDRIEDKSALKSADVKQWMEEIAISNIEMEMQNEHLQNTRIQLELELAHSVELFDFASPALFHIEATGLIGKSNLAGASMLGIERARLLGRKFKDFFARHQSDSIAHWLSHEYPLTRGERDVLTLLDPALPVKQVRMDVSHLSGGRGSLVTLTDVTEQTLLAHRASTLQEQFKLITRIACDGFWSWNTMNAEVNYSDQLTKLYGYSVAEFGHTIDAWRDRIHPSDRNAFLQSCQDCLSGTASSFSCEQRVLCKDGAWKWIQCRGAVQSVDKDGTVQRISGVHIDTTDQKRMELRKQERIDQLQAVFDSMPGRHALLNGDGTVVDANSAWGQQTVGVHFGSVLPTLIGNNTQFKQQAVRGIAESISGAQPNFKMTYTRNHGPKQKWFLLASHHVSQDRVRAFASLQDISTLQAELSQSSLEERFFKQAQQEFNRARRYGRPLTVIALNWNASTGGIGAELPAAAHAKILELLTGKFRHGLRGSDLIGTTSPNTFAMVLADTTLEGAEALAQRLLEQTIERPLNIFGTSVFVAIRVGICGLENEISFIALLKRSEAAIKELREPRGYGVVVDSTGGSSLC